MKHKGLVSPLIGVVLASFLLAGCSTPSPGEANMYPLTPTQYKSIEGTRYTPPGKSYATGSQKKSTVTNSSSDAQFGRVPDLSSPDSSGTSDTPGNMQSMHNTYPEGHPANPVDPLQHAGY